MLNILPSRSLLIQADFVFYYSKFASPPCRSMDNTIIDSIILFVKQVDYYFLE